jgi:hypothetical protein
MRRLSILLCAAFVIVSIGTAQDDPAKEPIKLKELRARNVVGELGVPLGKAVEIKAEVVSGNSTRRLADSGSYLLRVMDVDGRNLTPPTLMRFEVHHHASVELPNHTWALFELKHGEKAKKLTSAQLADLEKGYVGSNVQLLVYEVGSFRGFPGQLPDDAPIWQDVGFGFYTSLTVLTDRSAKSKKRDSSP